MSYQTSSESYSSIQNKPKKYGKDSKGYAHKKLSYNYASTGSNLNKTHNNINLNSNDSLERQYNQSVDQLDALLEDLKSERQLSSRSRDGISTTTYKNIVRDKGEPYETITTTRKYITSAQPEHEIFDNYGSSSNTNSNFNRDDTLNRSSNNLQNNYQSSKVVYESTSRKLPVTLDNSFESRNNVLRRSNNLLESTELIKPLANSTAVNTSTEVTDIEQDLQNITLGDGILPAPGTKVTTTVRTYTYEIPANASSTISRSHSQNLNQYNTYNTLQRLEDQRTSTSSTIAPRSPHSPLPYDGRTPQTITYNTTSYSTLNKPDDRPPLVSNRTYELREHRETHTRGAPIPVPVNVPVNVPLSSPGNETHQRIIEYNVHNKEDFYGTPRPLPAQNVEHHITRVTKNENTSTINRNLPYPNGTIPATTSPYPTSPGTGSVPGPTVNRYYYHESTHNVNTVNGPDNQAPVLPSRAPPNNYLPNDYPPRREQPLQEPPNTYTITTHKYSSTNNTQQPGPRPERYTAQPSPFPVNDSDLPNGNPPQRVEELMQSLGTTTTVDSANLNTPRKREIDTSVATPNQYVPSVNKAGREVYYPPGHEMTLRREEYAAGSAGGGRWAKGSGMYEAESGYKSSSKTKSGGAMVPVCLPLCCAMPCSIM